MINTPKSIPRIAGNNFQPELIKARQVSTTGAMLVGASNNCVHPAVDVASTFIATSQDEANVAEAITGITYTELLPNNDLYWRARFHSPTP